MPLYDYKCTACGRTGERQVPYEDRVLDPSAVTSSCPTCGSYMQYQTPRPGGILLKGSGFYKSGWV